MIWGKNDVGKTCLTFQIMSKLQDEMGILFTDAEYKYDPIWAMQNGVDAENTPVLKPDNLEEYLNILIDMAGSTGMNVIDSAVSVASDGEMADKKGNRDMNDNTIALNARKMSQFFRVATARLSKAGTITLILNQVRTAGIGGYATYEDYPGGQALKFYCASIIKAIRSKTTAKEIPEYGLTPSHDVTLKVNKGINETKSTTTTFFVESGFDPLADLIIQLREYNFIVEAKNEEGKKKVGYYKFHDSDETYRLSAMYPIVEERFDELYRRLMETEEPMEEINEPQDIQEEIDGINE